MRSPRMTEPTTNFGDTHRSVGSKVSTWRPRTPAPTVLGLKHCGVGGAAQGQGQQLSNGPIEMTLIEIKFWRVVRLKGAFGPSQKKKKKKKILESQPRRPSHSCAARAHSGFCWSHNRWGLQDNRGPNTGDLCSRGHTATAQQIQPRNLETND